MPAHTARPSQQCASPVPEPARLRSLACDLLGLDLPPTAFGLRLTRHGGCTLSTRPLLDAGPGSHPADLLVGFHAPAAWGAFGVVGLGRVQMLRADGSPLEWFDHPGAPSRGSGDRSARVVHLVSRAGSSCTAIVPAPGDIPQVYETDAPVAGILSDACRRVLSLPTAPSDMSLAAWASTAWLDRVLAALLAGTLGAHARWHDLIALHPCRAALSATATPQEVLRSLDALLGDGWEGFRRYAETGTDAYGLQGTLIECDQASGEFARWLDAPSFARHCESLLPPQAMLWPALDELLDQLAVSDLGAACER